MYSPKVLEQFQNSANVGDVPDADAMVEITNSVCGDILRLTLKVCGGRVTAARFRARGCVAAIACGSQLVDMVKGRPLEQVRRLRREQLVKALGGLAKPSLHASQLAIETLAAALRQVE